MVTNTPSKRMVRLTMQSVMQKPMLMMTDQRIPWTPVEVVEAAAAVETVVAEAAVVTVVEVAVAEMVKETESTAEAEVEAVVETVVAAEEAAAVVTEVAAEEAVEILELETNVLSVPEETQTLQEVLAE